MSAPLLEVRSLRVEFEGDRRAFARGRFAAVDDVGFTLAAGETLGLVGESGSGKSTLARALLRLVPAAAGEVLWRGENLLTLPRAKMRARRRELQIVFQDPLASLDPRMPVGEILEEPLRIFEPRIGARERRTRIARMLERVGLAASAAGRYPHEFSGGQCQRIGIARAMMPEPRLLVCDEPVSSLDVSIQGQIVNLLAQLQREHGMAMLFISHNLAVVRHLSHRVLVMYRGRLVEVAPRDALFSAPLHPYTRALLAAVPQVPRTLRAPTGAGAGTAAAAVLPAGLEAEPDAPPDVAPAVATQVRGCGYRLRCRYAAPVCAERPPALAPAGPDRRVACARHADLPAWRSPAASAGDPS